MHMFIDVLQDGQNNKTVHIKNKRLNFFFVVFTQDYTYRADNAAVI